MAKREHTLIQNWLDLSQKTQNCLCLGLDPDIRKIPNGYEASISGLSHFLKDYIDITQELCISYKPNISFFEAYGIEGLRLLEEIISHIHSLGETSPPVILDAKRGDIGNTSAMQARFLFDYFNADASTLHPYMGYDSLEPFFRYKEKYHFVLGLTSNPGSKDFERLTLDDNQALYSKIIKTLSEWNNTEQNIGVVVGATQKEMASIRPIDPSLVFLIPGVGAQGGVYQTALKNGQNTNKLALINVSRAILYSSKEKSDLNESVRSAINSILSETEHV